MQDQSDPQVWAPILNRPKRFISKEEVTELTAGGWNAVLAHEKCRSLVRTIDRLRKITNPADSIAWLVANHEGIVREPGDDEPIRWIDSLITSAKRFDTVQAFLRHIDWVVEKSKEPKTDVVQLMTMHMSKGLEFETVFIPGMVEGILPHKKSVRDSEIREETRLCYVAMTRAKENLYLFTAKVYGEEPMEMSRYLQVLQEG